MAVLVDSGRSAIAESVKAGAIHLAWGRGAASWDSDPQPPPLSALALLAEVGRVAPSLIQFCNPDPAGAIILPERSFAASSVPTRFLHMRFVFDFADGAGETIRELGIYLRGERAGHVPAAKRYLLPADMASQGRLYMLDRVDKFTRPASERKTYDYVVQF